MSGVEASDLRLQLRDDLLDISAPAIGCYGTSPFTSDIDRLWTGCMDPFVQYTVEMNHRTRELVDLGEQNNADSFTRHF
jgi:hypothetical protein